MNAPKINILKLNFSKPSIKNKFIVQNNKYINIKRIVPFFFNAKNEMINNHKQLCKVELTEYTTSNNTPLYSRIEEIISFRKHTNKINSK